MNMQQQSANIAVMASAGAFLSFFTLATPILIYHISKKYVTQLNYNKLEDTYTAITYNFFLRKKEVRINFVQTCKIIFSAWFSQPYVLTSIALVILQMRICRPQQVELELGTIFILRKGVLGLFRTTHTPIRVDMVGTNHDKVLTQWRHMPLGQFCANIFLIQITSTYFWASEVFKNQRF